MNKKATVGAVAEGLCSEATLPISEAETFLQLLGKDRACTWFRNLTPTPGKGSLPNVSRGGRDLQGFDQAALEADNRTASIYFITGDADQATGKAGAVTDADVHTCRAVFVEWDDQPIDWQVQAWRELGLPEPTAMVQTGGKSVHCYWRLAEPMSPAEWRVLQARLIAHAGGDKACKNPSRLMRLPGFRYVDKATGQPTDRIAVLIHQADVSYLAAEIEDCLRATSSKPVTKASTSAARSIHEVNAAAQFIPQRIGDQGTYPSDRNALCGCSAALGEAGFPDPDNAALELLGHLWPSKAAARQVLESTTTRNAASFWAIARERGYDLKRTQPHSPSRSEQHQSAIQQPAKRQPKSWEERNCRKLSHTRAMACLERCIEVQAQRERNSLRRRARLIKAAKDLGLAYFVKPPEIAQRVLEEKARWGGENFKPLTAADRVAMPKPVVRWLVPGLLPAGDLSIIGGRAKVGKTRLAIAITAAVLRSESFLDFPAPTTAPPVLLVTDDQSDGDTADMLTALDLWQHPHLIWSRSFRLTETDLQALLDSIKANPGALVVLDSLRSICRALHYGENDPEIGATLYDLKQSVIDAGGTLLLIHHCNKAIDLVGTEALSGHNAIAGAANTVLTMHYLPGEKGQPNKSSPDRRLFREARSGQGFDLVVGRDHNTFRKVATMDQWQQQAKDPSKAERLTTLQQQIKDVLVSKPETWMTRRQVCEAIGVTWAERGRNAEARRVDDALRRLVVVGGAQSARSGTEATYKSSHENTRTTRTNEPTCSAKGYESPVKEPDNPDSAGVCLNLSGMSQNAEDSQKQAGDLLARLSGMSDVPYNPVAFLKIGNEVERMCADGSWRNGWCVADVVSTSKGTRYRIEQGGESLNVTSGQIRPCGEAA
jgi:hypothetical protein